VVVGSRNDSVVLSDDAHDACNCLRVVLFVFVPLSTHFLATERIRFCYL
jgi:hypothetical protein